MKTLIGALGLAAVVGFAASAYAQQEVTIVYPIDGGSYPLTSAGLQGLVSAYITASFSVRCPGGSRSAQWGFDNTWLGNIEFYDQSSVQFVQKLPGGIHVFKVDSGSCGTASVTFKVQ